MDAIEEAKRWLEKTKRPSNPSAFGALYMQDVEVIAARAVVANLIPIAESSLLSMEARVKAARGDRKIRFRDCVSASSTLSENLKMYANAGGISLIRTLAGRFAMLAIHLAHATGISLYSMLKKTVEN